ncbi:MAG: dihydropteroate synthase [Candidatus Thermoplasmatota archaeon]
MSITNSINCRGRRLKFDKTLIMGILNVTPDSFSDGGLYNKVESAVEHAIRMVDDGADIIDIGGESTRPGSTPVSITEEIKRVKPVLERLVDEIKVPISIDTYKPEVAEVVLDLGVHMINDITGLSNPDMRRIASLYKVPVVIMHMQGTPRNMQDNPTYKDVVSEVKVFLEERAKSALSDGVEGVIVDPGIGFGKNLDHNINILSRLEEFKTLGYPLLIGPSRKSFIGALTGLPVHDRLEGTLAAVSIAVMKGADIIRVHDVKACRRALQVVDAIKRGVRDEYCLSKSRVKHW